MLPRRTARLGVAGDLFGQRVQERKSGEFSFQLALLEFLARVLPADAVVIHVPNGGRDASWRRRCAALGATAGAPDLLILWQGRAYAIECKSKSGDLSPDQQAFHSRLRGTRIPVFTARTLEGVQDFLLQCNIPLKGRLT